MWWFQRVRFLASLLYEKQNKFHVYFIYSYVAYSRKFVRIFIFANATYHHRFRSFYRYNQKIDLTLETRWLNLYLRNAPGKWKRNKQRRINCGNVMRPRQLCNKCKSHRNICLCYAIHDNYWFFYSVSLNRVILALKWDSFLFLQMYVIYFCVFRWIHFLFCIEN